MSKKPSLDSVHMPGYINQSKISRNDRFAQMSHQEKLIEQKKKEILAKLEAKRKATKDEIASSKSAHENKSKSPPKESKSGPNLNLFSNDGSFLDTFKQIKDKRFESKLKSFKAKDNSDRSHSDGSKSSYSRWSQRKRSPSPKNLKSRVSRFDKTNSFEQKITINTSFSTSIPIQSCQEPPISVTSSTLQHPASLQQLPLQNPLPAPQPLLEELQQPSITFQEVLQTNQSIIAAPPILLNVPPPQIVQAPVVMQQPSVITVTPAQGPPVLTASQPTLALPQSVVLTTVTLSPTTIIASQPCAPVPVSSNVAGPTACIQTMELSSIPPPSPIQVQNIPQPEPLNTLNIPPPAPLQVQNIPTPASIQLNEIPNPKPIDILAIPTPTDDGMSNPEFIKNIPPPNKSIPPPSVTDGTSCLTLPGLLGQSQTIGVQSIASGAQGVVLHNLQSGLQPGSFGTITSISVGVLDNSATLTTMSPSLVPQPVLPPAGVCMNQPPPLDVSCPPPMLSSAPPPMPPLNMPPPIPPPIKVEGGFDAVGRVGGSIPDINAGTAEYEAMASLGRMVVQCGSGFEDIVRQRKDRDPNLWFLFHKDSAAYHQYQLLIETFRAEMIKTECPSHDDRYDPEAAMSDVSGKENGNFKRELQPMDGESSAAMKRKRRSRWGEKAIAFPAQPGVATVSPQLSTTGGVMLTKITRQDPGLIQYALQNYGRQDLTEEEWCKVEDHYKIKLLHQDMLKKRQEVEKLQQHGKNKYEYDSDEEIDGGTWEHKLREKEMLATQLWAQELTRQAEGKHHIGDFLPPEELNRFMEKHTALKEGRQPDLSDYKDFKIKEDNVGFRMLQKLGWTEGQSLGASGTSGIIQPIDKAPTNHEMNQGLGMDEIIKNEDEYESYRRRMMLAYRFRPNPLNNPRRPYY